MTSKQGAMRLALILAASAAIFCALGGGVPRLIGYGCEDAPYGLPQLAITESDYRAPCRSIEPLPWTWVRAQF